MDYFITNNSYLVIYYFPNGPKSINLKPTNIIFENINNFLICSLFGSVLTSKLHKD